uniref:Uncharacterized protein n=1 Tax=Ananas comosus var. bracteatus TaxID=296719 RepID=A0A6V7QAY6_ANACO|nr:unnamed protein product [Ananas comosus var. bracteatus]
MCHSSLSIELGDWVNFTTGQNGSEELSVPLPKVATFKSRLDALAFPAATKADLRAKISQLEDQLRKAKKKIGEENIQKAVKAATEVAEAAASERKALFATAQQKWVLIQMLLEKQLSKLWIKRI